MIVLQLAGRIGDQLFQYAAARNFSLIYSCELLIDNSWFIKNKKNKLNPNKLAIDGFNTHFKYAGSVIINNFLKRKSILYLDRYPSSKNYKVIRENKKTLAQDFYNTNPPFLMSGEFKSEAYFEDNIEQIMDELTVNMNSQTNDISINTTKPLNESIAIYISKRAVIKNQNVEINEINYDYYKNGIEYFLKDNAVEHFLVFTDFDIDITDELGIKNNSEVIRLFENEFEWKNIYLMSQCKCFISDNSATSWWAAWLNTTNNRTIIIPQSFSFNKPNITHDKIGIEQNWIKL